MPFLAALTVLFIGLKLTDHIEWSWWWVTGPIWIPVAILALIVFPIAGILDYNTKKMKLTKYK